jgi:hypothetical protein
MLVTSRRWGDGGIVQDWRGIRLPGCRPGLAKLSSSVFSTVRLIGKCGSLNSGKILDKLRRYKLFAIGRRPD